MSVKVAEGKVYIGFTKKTKDYGMYTVIEKLPVQRYIVEFDNGYIKHAHYKEVLLGRIKNPTYPKIYGVACIGEGIYTAKNPDNTRWNSPAYEVWVGILKRCYSVESRSYPIYGGAGAFVCEGWLNFQNFAEWYYKQPMNPEVGMWAVDKDLQYVGSKEYCPEKCNLVPFAVNSLFTGARVATGATYKPKRDKWVAQIQRGRIGGTGKKRQCYLGAFATEQEAIDAYTAAKVEHCAEVAMKNKGYIPEVVYDNLTSEVYVRAVLLEKRK